MRVRAVVHFFIAIILLAPDCCLPGAWDLAAASTKAPPALTDYRVGVRSAWPGASWLETDAFSILQTDRLSMRGSHLARREPLLPSIRTPTQQFRRWPGPRGAIRSVRRSLGVAMKISKLQAPIMHSKPSARVVTVSAPGRKLAGTAVSWPSPTEVRSRSGWPKRRAPFAAYLAGLGLIGCGLLVGLVHHPSTTERAADLRGFVSDMQADIGSCAADVGASLTALRAVEAGATSANATAQTIAISGASDCSPANDELIDDLIQYQVTESLASLRLGRVVTGLVAWASPDAVQVQSDVAAVLAARARGAAAEAGASDALRRSLRTLNAQRAAVDSIIRSASRALSAHASPPPLPG